jgi:hypothetical protein
MFSVPRLKSLPAFRMKAACRYVGCAGLSLDSLIISLCAHSYLSQYTFPTLRYNFLGLEICLALFNQPGLPPLQSVFKVPQRSFYLL